MKEESMEMINRKSVTSCIRNDWNNKKTHKTSLITYLEREKKILPPKTIKYYLLVAFTRAFGISRLSQ